MDQTQALAYIRNFFHELFDLHNLKALDDYLHQDYFDDDIGDPLVDHLQNSKEYLTELFKRDPLIKVNVVDVMIHDDVISAFLEWYRVDSDQRQSLCKGVALFVIQDEKMIKRHTFIYRRF
jgi:predicted SnoaL-like aldol condensation-catalyzing enzyme